MERITEGGKKGQWAEMRQIAGDDKRKNMDGSERDETFYKIAKDLECQFLSCHNPISPASDRVGRRRRFPERIWRCVRKGPKLKRDLVLPTMPWMRLDSFGSRSAASLVAFVLEGV